MNFVDIANLRWKDLQGERLPYKRQKTGHSLNLKLHPKAQEILKYYFQLRDESDYIFPIFSTFHDTPQRKVNRRKKVLKEVNAALKQIGGEIGVGEITFYVARHTYATHLKYSKVNTSMISEALGHKDEKITQVYLDSFGNDALDALDEELL